MTLTTRHSPLTTSCTDRYYVQRSVCGRYWNLYDRQTSHEGNQTGHACLGLYACLACAENIAAEWNERPRPNPIGHANHSRPAPQTQLAGATASD